MTPWEQIIGWERERELLDTVMDVLLDLDAGECLSVPKPMPYSWLCNYISECWNEGNPAEAGYTLDDLAGLSWRLKQLSQDQFDDMVRAYWTEF